MELALELSEAICRSGGTELTDLIYVAERLKTADDLGNVRPEIITEIPKSHIVVKADYLGPKIFWKLEAIGSDADKRHYQEIADYFEDLGKRVGLELKYQNRGGFGGSYPNTTSPGYKILHADASTPSGKPLNIFLTQYYTYEQELAHRAS